MPSYVLSETKKETGENLKGIDDETFGEIRFDPKCDSDDVSAVKYSTNIRIRPLWK